MYTYWQIFKQAFKIAWENPRIWLFGLFTAILGSAGGLELLMGGYGFGGQGIIVSIAQGLIEGGLFTVAGFHGFVKILFIHPIYLFVAVLLALVFIGISIFVLWFSLVSQSALIGQAVSISRSKPLTWRASFELGLAKFWRVFSLNLVGQVIVWILVGLVGLTVFFDPSRPSLVIATFFLESVIIAVAFILLLILSFIVKFAICGVVLKDWQLSTAIKETFKLFKNNWLLGIEISTVLFLINFIVSAIMLYLLSWLLFFFLKLYAAFYFGLVFIFLVLLAIFLITQIILVIFHWSTWSIIFELLSTKKPVLRSFISRVFSKVSSQ
ncbi:MAG: hypothetical protein WC508_01680 [Patescibacteria group bacterium]